MVSASDERFYASIRGPVETSVSLRPEAYRSSTFFDLEQVRVFRKGWVCVGYTSQIRETGDVLQAEVGGQPIFLTRDEGGALRAFYNVCRHRGSRLVCDETRRKEIRCPYHAWSYRLDGRLERTPLFQLAEDVAGTFRKEDHGLLPVRVEAWGCFVFVTQDPDTLPLSSYLGDLSQRYARFPLSEMVLVRRKAYAIRANWKLVAENFLEYYHLPWVHPELTTVTAIEMHRRNQGPGMYMSFASPLSRGNTPIDADYLPAMPGLGEVEAQSGYFPHVFPNLAMFLMPHHIFSLILSPTAAGTTAEHGDLLVHPSVLSEPDIEAKLDEIFAFYDMVNLQDVAAVERVQDGIRVEAYPGGRLTHRFEEPLHRFQNMVADAMLETPRIPPGDETDT